jgi:hypothetical protein
LSVQGQRFVDAQAGAVEQAHQGGIAGLDGGGVGAVADVVGNFQGVGCGQGAGHGQGGARAFDQGEGSVLNIVIFTKVAVEAAQRRKFFSTGGIAAAVAGFMRKPGADVGDAQGL